MKQQAKWRNKLVAAAAAVALALGVAPASAWASSFNDVPDNSWYTGSVEWANDMGALTGYDNGEFGPNDGLTRSQAAVILYRYLGDGQQVEDQDKTDVDQTAYYAPAVNWAVKNHVMNGYSGSTSFGPNDTLTREQAAVVLANAANADTNVSDAAYNKLENTNQTHDWAKPSLVWAVNKGVIHGVGNVDLEPRATVTRAQMATMLQNADTQGVFVVPTTTVTTEFLGTDAYGQYEVWAKAANQQVKRVNLTADVVAQGVLDSTPGLTANTSYTPYGWYLAGITKNGRTLAWNEKTGQYWSFYVNGEYSMVGASSVHVHNGDVLFFPYKNDDQPLPALR